MYFQKCHMDVTLAFCDFIFSHCKLGNTSLEKSCEVPRTMRLFALLGKRKYFLWKEQWNQYFWSVFNQSEQQVLGSDDYGALLGVIEDAFISPQHMSTPAQLTSADMLFFGVHRLPHAAAVGMHKKRRKFTLSNCLARFYFLDIMAQCDKLLTAELYTNSI